MRLVLSIAEEKTRRDVEHEHKEGNHERGTPPCLVHGLKGRIGGVLRD